MASGRDRYLGSSYRFNVVREQMRNHPGPLLDFALGGLRQSPPAWLPDFVREHSALGLRRRRAGELEEFLTAASSVLAREYSADVAPDTILVAPSGRAAISAIVASLIEPGDGVLVTEPGYPAFARVAAQRGAPITVANLDPQRGFDPDLTDLAPEPDPRLRIAALNYPNNPTGALLPSSALAALCERLDPDTLLFNDAVYGPLTYERPPYSLLGEVEATNRRPCLEMHSLGKLFSLGPLAVAFLVGHKQTVDEVRQYSEFAWTQISSLQLRVATRCLESWEHVHGVRDGFARRLARLRDVVLRLGFEPYAAVSGTYMLCRRPRGVRSRSVDSAAAAAELLLREFGLAVVPWDVAPHGYLRFSAAYGTGDLEALAGLGGGLPLVSG